MPRCQRTFRRLPGGTTVPGSGAARWECPHCPDAEVYASVRDADLLDYARRAEAALMRDFGPPDDASRPTLLLYGLRPECVHETDDRRYDLYLQTGSDPFQLRLQIGHEMFHRVCSRGRIFHWTHEMLACVASVRLLRQSGLHECAEQNDADYRRQAEALPPADLFGVDLWAAGGAYPVGYYGRAYVIGRELEAAVGWAALTPLARTLDASGTPDILAWLGTLTDEATRAAAGRILGITPVKR